MNPPGPPHIVNDGHRIVSTDFFDPECFWDQAKLSWLDCHLGYLRLLYIGHPVPQHRWSFSEICILTRGIGPGNIEMLELYFPSAEESRNPLPVHLYGWQCNRFPTWQPGKRCWELEVYCGNPFAGTCSVFFRRRVFFREGKIPCRQWWDGPRPDGFAHPLEAPKPCEEYEAKLRAVKESRPGEGCGKKKPGVPYVSPKERTRRTAAAQSRQAAEEVEQLRKRMEGR